MKALYLVLAIVGGTVPYAFFIQHFSSEGAGKAHIRSCSSC